LNGFFTFRGPGTFGDGFPHQVQGRIEAFQIMGTFGFRRIPNQSLTGQTPVAGQTFGTTQQESQFVAITEEACAKRSTDKSSGTSDEYSHGKLLPQFSFL
jgi:hypothetical protein